MKFILPTFLLLLLSLPASAQVAVSGNVQDVGVANVTSGMQVTFELQNFGGAIPRVPGGPVIGRVLKSFSTDASGNFTGSLYPNSVIEPQGTWYRVCVVNLGQELRCNKYLINGPFNLSTAVPITPSTNIGPNQFITESFPFTQLTPATTWTVTHNFNDSGTIVFVKSTAGDQIFPDKVNCHTDRNSCVLTFVTPTAGFAIAMHAAAINIATNQPNAIIGNATSPQVFGGQPITFQGPITFTNGVGLTNPGDFTNSIATNKEYHSAVLNGCNFTNEEQAVYGTQYSTDAFGACVTVPAGSLVSKSAGFGAYVVAGADSANRVHGNTTPFFGQCRLAANNAACWGGGNGLIEGGIGLTGQNASGYELDINPMGSFSFFKGFYFSGLNLGGTLPADASGFELATPYQLPFAFISDRGSAAVGLQLNDNLGTSPSQSQAFQFISHDNVGPGGTAHVAQINEDANGNLVFIPGGGNGATLNVNGGGWCIPGSTSGSTCILPQATGANFQTLPSGTGTVADINQAQSWTGNQSNIALVTPTIGGGSAINAVYRASGLSLNSAFTSITAGTCQEQTLTLVGAVITGIASVQPTATPGANFNWSSWVSATNTISVRLCAGSTATPTSVTWNASVVQ